MHDPNPTQRIQVGDARITYLADGAGRVSPLAMFPNTNDTDWPADDRDENGRITTSIGAFLVETGDARVLVDCGIGPVEREFPAFGTFGGGSLLESLAATGVEPGAITHVVFTHLHVDHVGWAAGEDGTPTFANAAHHVAEAEWAFWRANPDVGGAPSAERFLDPLEDRIRWVGDGDAVAPGIRAMATPGHTPGHLAYVVDAGDVQAVLVGDVFHHVRQFGTPGITCAFDIDATTALRTRARLARHAEQPGTTLGAPHLTPGPFGRLTRGPKGLVFQRIGQPL